MHEEKRNEAKGMNSMHNQTVERTMPIAIYTNAVLAISAMLGLSSVRLSNRPNRNQKPQNTLKLLELNTCNKFTQGYPKPKVMWRTIYQSRPDESGQSWPYASILLSWLQGAYAPGLPSGPVDENERSS
jgi:hypothetical protein